MIRVLIVDDHAVVRHGLNELLDAAPNIEVVGTAVDGPTSVSLANDASPDVVLMDLSMPGTDGVDATRQILAARPETRVVILTAFSEQRRILEALDAGAVGYLLKDAAPDELIRGVSAAAAGESPFSPRAAAALVASHAQRQNRLTAREREVLKLLAHGFANKAIARSLGVSEKTVKAHLTSAFARIGVTDRTQAALWAIRNGLSEGP
jgi:DNA-binding NarL/FixJ family response regulator